MEVLDSEDELDDAEWEAAMEPSARDDMHCLMHAPTLRLEDAATLASADGAAQDMATELNIAQQKNLQLEKELARLREMNQTKCRPPSTGHRTPEQRPVFSPPMSSVPSPSTSAADSATKSTGCSEQPPRPEDTEMDSPDSLQLEEMEIAAELDLDHQETLVILVWG